MKNDNWKFPTYLIGSAVGLVLGLLSAHFYTRTVEEAQDGNMPGKIGTGDIFKLGLTAIGLMRSISDLGAKQPDDKR
jgi:hypothetical protein